MRRKLFSISIAWAALARATSPRCFDWASASSASALRSASAVRAAGEDLGRLAAADRVEVPGVVGHVLDLQGVELEPEGAQVLVRLLDEALCELEPVLVDLFRGEGGQHAAQVALEGLLGDLVDLVHVLLEEALHRVAEDGLGGGDLHVGDRVDLERDAAGGVGVLHRQGERDGLEAHPRGPLHDGDAQGPSAADHPVAHLAPVGHPAPPAREDDHLVGLADQEKTADERHDREDQHQSHGSHNDHEVGHHNLLSLLSLKPDSSCRRPGRSRPGCGRRPRCRRPRRDPPPRPRECGRGTGTSGPPRPRRPFRGA